MDKIHGEEMLIMQFREKRFWENGKVGCTKSLHPHLDHNFTDRMPEVMILEVWFLKTFNF